MFRNSRSRTRGQALVEFALMVPMFLALTMGVVDAGRVIWASTSLSAAAREGARLAIVHGGSPNDPCPMGPLTPDYDAPAPSPSTSCPYPSPSKQAIKNAAIAAAQAGGTGISATVCYGVGCTGDTDSTAGDGNNARGNPVTVTVSSQVALSVPALLGFSAFTISGSSTMLVNH